MNCESARQLLPLLSYGELSFDEEERLEAHLESCAACRAEREALQAMEVFLARAEREPAPGLLQRNRRLLAETIAAERASSQTWWRRVGAWLANPPAWAKPVGAVAVFVLGFGIARAPWAANGVPAPQTIERVRIVGADGSGGVRVAYDEVRPREVRGSLSDESIRRVLLAATQTSTDPGVRVESLELLKRRASADTEVRDALLNVLLKDRNSGVRLKALEALRSFNADSELRRALCQVLLSDDNPAVRATAVDLLTTPHEPEVVGALQELLRREQDAYIRARSQSLLTAVKASASTF